ncbi:MAG: PAS domain S-box protein [Acidobacteria bacterium]|nr:PAS domain S-box protein [Acidobacteriota bacterium]
MSQERLTETQETPTDAGAVPVEAILCTEELQRRPSRNPDYELESRTFVTLAQVLADAPDTVLQTLADTILHICRAGSAGVSLLTIDDGGKRFYWPAIAGKWKAHIGGGTPRDFGPCGDVLDRNSSLLFRHVERRYTYFAPVTPLVEEALLVPFYVHGKAVGTIWAVSHDVERKFDAEDERIMRSLGQFASAAYQVILSIDAVKLEANEQQKIAIANSRLAAIVDSSDDVIISKDLNGTIKTWNRSAERILGYTAEEAIGQNIMLIIPQERQAEEIDILDRIRRGERVDHFETIRRKKDGSFINLSLTISPIKDKTGKIVGASKVARDISEQQRAHGARNLLAAIVNSSDDAIISKNLKGVIMTWNSGAERIFGYTGEEAIGKHIFLLIPEDRHNEEDEILGKIQRGERIEHFETVRRRKDGTLLDVSLTISPVRDLAGRIVGASKIARDITATKRADKMLRESEERFRMLADALETQVQLRTQQLIDRNAEIQQQTEQLRELSTQLLKSQDNERRRIARELHDSAGQLIAALGMSLAGVGRHVSFNPPLAEALEEAQDLVRELNKEIRTTTYLLHPPLLEENGLPQAIQWYTQGLQERGGLTVELVVSEGFGRLDGDLELTVFRIVQESLTNAHRHSGSKTATIRLTREGQTVRMEVEDYGRGFSPSASMSGASGRTGVGIMGMRERVRQLGGQMEVRSNPGGTMISVVLPLPIAEPRNPIVGAHIAPSMA